MASGTQMNRLIGGIAVLLVVLVTIPGTRAAEPVWVDLNLEQAWVERQQKLWQDEGTRQARTDIAAGKLKKKSIGRLNMSYWLERQDRLLRSYGIEEDNLGCSVDPGTSTNMYGYNVEMEKEIERRYGPKFWDRFEADLHSSHVGPNKRLQPIALNDAPTGARR